MGMKILSKSIKAKTEERVPKFHSYPFLLWKKCVNYSYQSDLEYMNCPTVRE